MSDKQDLEGIADTVDFAHPRDSARESLQSLEEVDPLQETQYQPPSESHPMQQSQSVPVQQTQSRVQPLQQSASSASHAPPNQIYPYRSNSSSESLSSSIDSAANERHKAEEPVALQNETATNRRRRSSVLSSSLPGMALQSIRSMTRTSSMASSNYTHLSRIPSTYTVRDIYGDMDDNDIALRRSRTRSTILTSLSHRVRSEIERRPSIVVREDDIEAGGSDSKEETAEEETEGEEEDTSRLYSNISDVPVPAKDYGGEFSSIDPELVTWDGPDDPAYPRNWPISTKIFQTFMVSLFTFISPISSSIMSPAMDQISKDINMNNPSVSSLSVSIMVLAWAIGPLLIAPMSESDRIGRRPVLNISIWILFAFNLGCAFVKNPTQLCILRFLGGLGGCAPLNVGAGTLADLWSDSDRQVAMAAYSISPTLGPVLAPVISSFIIQKKSWHWIFYVLAIFNGAVGVLGTFFFHETYSPRLLRKKAEFLRKETQNEHLHTIYEIADGETTWGKISVSMSRPIKLLFTHPMIIGLGAFMAFVYGFMYLMIVTFPQVYRGTYGFSIGISGLMYLPMGIGYMIGTVFWAYFIHHTYESLKRKNGGVAKPEYRLPWLCFSGVGIPVGLIWYGWSAEKHLHWIMPAIGSAIYAFSFIAVFQCIQNYLIDMNNRFAASSVAAAAVFRSCFGFAFPLFADQMYDTLGYGWGNTTCALIGLALGLPFPIFCLMYGEKLRKWANKRMDKEQAIRDARNLARLRAMNGEGAEEHKEVVDDKEKSE